MSAAGSGSGRSFSISLIRAASAFRRARSSGRHRVIELDADESAPEHLVGEQPLAFRPLTLGFCNGLLDVRREVSLDGLRPEPFAVWRLELADFRVQRRLFRVDLSDLLVDGLNVLRGGQWVGGLDVTEQRRLQRVVVALQNRIELVIVTACALKRQAERSLADRRNHVVQVVVPVLRVVALTNLDSRTQAQERRGDAGIDGLAVHLVARQLLGEEDVVRLVLVESANDVIAIAPGIGAIVVVLVAVGVRIPRHIQPVASPAFAVVWRCEQLVDQPVPGARLVVSQERGQLARRGWQSEQIQIGAPHQRAAIGARSGFESSVLPCLLQEAVNGVLEAGRDGG